MSIPTHSLPKVYILAGPTGSGKSEIIRHFQKNNVQALDLETLCGHDGSVFAPLTFGKQPTSYQFHKQLLKIWNRFVPEKPVFIESELSRIGNLAIPSWLAEIIQMAPLILLDVDHGLRQERLSRIIANADGAVFLACLAKLHFKITPEQLKLAEENFKAGNFTGTAGILMKYYDSTPGYTFSADRAKFRLSIENSDTSHTADAILRLIEVYQSLPNSTL